MFSNYFNPVSKDVLKFKESSKPGTIGDSITIYTEGHFPDFQKSEVAIFGVNDYRGVLFEADFNLDMDAIRESFYALYVGNWNLRILDLGDLILGEDLSDTYFAISDLISNLISDGVVPIIIGGGQDLCYPIYKSYDSFNKGINICSIDSKFIEKRFT